MEKFYKDSEKVPLLDQSTSNNKNASQSLAFRKQFYPNVESMRQTLLENVWIGIDSLVYQKKSSILSDCPRLSVNVTAGNGTVSSTTEPTRGTWANPLEFILACVGYAVGLGNVWRFPYLVFRNGGGAFLVPYLLMVFIIGLPIFFAELFIGQYSGLGPIKAYHHLAPFFQGLGFCTLAVITYVTIYYMVVIAWIIFYFFASFLPILQWGHCNNDFNTDRCYSGLEDQHCKQNNTNGPLDQLFFNRTCQTVSSICSEYGLLGKNSSFCTNHTTMEEIPIRKVIKRVLSSEEYYYEYVLGMDGSSWSNWGYPRWQLVLCLAAGWIIAFLCLIKGVKSAGKVVYFTALFPYVILTALLIRGATLDGAGEGIRFYIEPNWETLLYPSVWGDAASQIFYSFGLACGSLVAFASYSGFKNNCHTDAIVVSFTNVFTAIFAGFSVFAILGFMSKNLEVPVSEVVQSGPGLAFIAYPEAVLLMPLPHLWSVLFFLMMFTLGLGSQFGGIEAICTSLMDHWPHLRDKRPKVTAGVCLACFIAGLPMVCNGGVYMFTLMEWHTASWAILLLGLAEVVIISWVYGMDRALNNLVDMGINLNRTVRTYWRVVWMVLTPIASVGVFAFTMTGIGSTEFNNYKFPLWADILGWSIGASTLIPFAFPLIYSACQPGFEIRNWFLPTKEWGPQEYSDSLDCDKKKSGMDNPGFEDV